MNKKDVIISTHNGLHHPDDVFSCHILKTIFSKTHNVKINRTRDKKILNQSHYLVDVGFEYAPLSGKFDHHQNNSPKREDGIPYSSCGLIWKHFGRKYITTLFPNLKNVNIVNKLWKKTDEIFLECDMLDNGLIKNKGQDIFNFILMLNDKGKIEAFENAMHVGGLYIKAFIDKEYKKIHDYLKIEKYIQDAISKNLNYLILPDEMEFDIKNNTGIHFVIHPYEDGKKYMFRVLPFDDDKTQYTYPFQKEYCGLTEEELKDKTNIDDICFIHKKGFCGSAKTLESALKMLDFTEWKLNYNTLQFN